MPNQTDSIWSRNPGLYEEALELAETGLGYAEIAAVFMARGIPITRSAVRNKMLCGLGPLVHAGKGAYVPKKLIEPRDGYHVPHLEPAQKHPQGWEPHVEENGDTATAISEPMETSNPDERTLIEGWKLDPNEWVIVGPINCRRWQSIVPIKKEITSTSEDGTIRTYWATIGYEKKWLHYYKSSLTRRDRNHREADVKLLLPEIMRMKARKTPAPTGSAALAVFLADPQLAKADGDGVTGTVERILDTIEKVKDYARDLRKIGVPIGPLYFFGMGDIIENCSEYYPQQTFTVQLNLRDQIKVARRLLVRAIKEWAPLFEKVVVAPVGGNHGEASRRDGRNMTDDADNLDTAIFEEAEEVISENQDAFGHVSFSIPRDSPYQVLDVCGTVVGTTHGQHFGNGATVMKKAEDWWKGQAIGEQPIGDARLLVSAHFHSSKESNIGAKTHIQCPAMEGASKYYRDRTGQESYKGMLTMVIGKDYGPAMVDGQRQGFDYKRIL